MTPGLLADENFPLSSVIALRHLGYDITSITKTSPGISNQDVVARAVREQCCMLTFDRDYGNFLFAHGASAPPALIYMRFIPNHPDESTKLVHRFPQNEGEQISGHLVGLDRDAYRLRARSR